LSSFVLEPLEELPVELPELVEVLASPDTDPEGVSMVVVSLLGAAAVVPSSVPDVPLPSVVSSVLVSVVAGWFPVVCPSL
jgi:hypothetical protein